MLMGSPRLGLGLQAMTEGLINRGERTPKYVGSLIGFFLLRR